MTEEDKSGLSGILSFVVMGSTAIFVPGWLIVLDIQEAHLNISSMDTPKLIEIVQRVNSSLGVTWANALLAANKEYMSQWQTISSIATVYILIHASIQCCNVKYNFVHIIERLTLTLLTQQLFILTPFAMPSSLSSGVYSVAYASSVLLLVDAGRHILGNEADVFINSAKFMFAHSLKEALENTHTEYTFLPIAAILLLYMLMREYATHKVLGEGICMMAFDEGCTMLLHTSWPLSVQVILSVLLGSVSSDLDPIVPQIQEYSRWQTSSSIKDAFSVLPFSLSCTSLVAMQASCFIGDSVPARTLQDIATITFFDAILSDSRTVLQNIAPGEKLFAFVLSLIMVSTTQTKTKK